MKILITGNMGYVGPVLVRRLRDSYPEAELIGLDMGYFGNCLSSNGILPECRVNRQHFADVRNFPAALLSGVDAVVYLAALSNDPLGHAFEEATLDINYRSCVRAAKMAKEAGVKSFVFASSCSVYGYAEDGARIEDVSGQSADCLCKIQGMDGKGPGSFSGWTVQSDLFAIRDSVRHERPVETRFGP